MKKLISIRVGAAALALVLFCASCSKNFQTINTSPDAVTTPTLAFVLPDIELSILDYTYYCNVSILGQVMNQMASYGSNFSTLTIGGSPEYHFTYQYGGPVRNIIDFISKTKGQPLLVNSYNIGRILRVYAFHSLTDLYGDVPYFQAGEGYLEGNLQPAYDPQSKIYADMLNELQDAASQLDPGKPLPQNDIVYQGNITNWKRFAYSLMLRLALRINKVDPANSAKYANLAYSSGLMQSNSDNFVVPYKPNTYYATISNGQATPVVYYNTWKLAEPFVAFLRDNHDPRIYVYSVLPNGDTAAAHQLGLPPNTPSNQVPLPIANYSTSPSTTFGTYSAPFVHLSYAQVELMLSELALKGVINGLGPSDAPALYSNGVTAAMNELNIYGGSYKLTPPAITAYLQAHPFNTANTDSALSQINTQYWVETHYNFYEQFANWRRSGYPRLDQTKYTIPRRLMYPVSELSINAANIQAAIHDQGPDQITTHVWWDK
ncbi:MAG TPA: SusD/RagB family nutrient-binding outer membrane lipoprotein [Puia sp.]|nr:SusD/RagB family nutrient-binding outer membrane lipoprotein [Puia sp.]